MSGAADVSIGDLVTDDRAGKSVILFHQSNAFRAARRRHRPAACRSRIDDVVARAVGRGLGARPVDEDERQRRKRPRDGASAGRWTSVHRRPDRAGDDTERADADADAEATDEAAAGEDAGDAGGIVETPTGPPHTER